MDKKNDLVLNILANPGFSLNNFYTVGLTADNTTVLDEDKYTSSQKIQDDPRFKDDSGNFSKTKFHEFYDTAIQAYDFMSTDQYNADFAAKVRSYHRDDIFAPKEQKRSGPDFSFTKMSNPDAFTSSIITLGKREEGKRTWDELAQTQKVLANPVEAMLADGSIDESKAIWTDSPNDSWFKDFTETRVAAQWDSDGTHIDPITGEETAHKKGELKTNANGMYYYENLDGRDVYGRRVLNKMNTLTTDGSIWNKYDFFDSDSRDKSAGGTMLKTLALCGSMFLPKVGKVVAGLSVANQTVGLLGTLGKMSANLSNEYLGTDFKNLSTLSEMEGWSKSVNRQTAKSEYAQDHMWSLENMIGLVGDVTAQFKEQRFLFETAPIVFKHKYGIVNSKNYKDKLTALEKQAADLRRTKVEDLLKTDTARAFRQAKEMQAIDHAVLSTSLDNYVKGYNKIGEVLAKGFMTGVTVGDTYGEAITQGASPLEATWLTLGHAAGEYAILNTGVGEWLFPELRYHKLHQNAIAMAAVNAKKETETLAQAMANATTQQATREAKQNFISKVFNIGKQTAIDLYKGYKSTGDRTIKAAFFNALGEGTEEVTEELLADFSKQCFNTIEWLRGKDTKLDAWDKGNIETLLQRYAMNFVGGFIGGGIAGFNLDNRKAIKALDNMTFDQAMQEIMYMCRNGEIKNFLKQVDKMDFLGDKNKSATKMIETVNGWEAAPGTKEDNQLVANRKMIHAQVQLFQDILKAEGLLISDESLLNKYTELIPEFRFAALVNSSTAGNLLQSYNNLCTKIVETSAALLSQKQMLTTDNKSETADVKEDIANDTKEQLNKTISDLKIRLQHANEDEAKELNKQLSELQKQLASKSEKSTVVQKLEEELKNLRKQRDDILQGKKTFEFARDAIFEMSEPINNSFIKPSFIRYAEQQEGTTIDKIPENRLAKLKEIWEKSNPSEQVHIAAGVFQNIIERSSVIVNQNAKAYTDLLSNQEVQELQRLAATVQNNAFLGDDKLASATDNLNGMAISLASAFNVDDAYKQAIQDRNKAQAEYEEVKKEVIENQKLTNEDTTISEENKKNRLTDLIQKLEEAKVKRDEAINKSSEILVQTTAERIKNGIEQFSQPYLDQGWANTQVKNSLLAMINFAHQYYEKLKLEQSTKIGEIEKDKNLSKNEALELKKPHQKLVSLYNSNKKLLTKIKKQVIKLTNSPIEALLDQFAISIDSKIKASQIIKIANESLEKSSSDLSQYSLAEDTRQQLKEILILMDLVANTLQGMKVDNGDLGNLYGYTKTLNQIAHKIGLENYVDMAQIDSNVAEIFLQDLNGIRSRVAFMLNVLNINQGQKLAEHRRVGINKNYLFYQKMVNFVNTDDEDWKDLDELKSIVDKAGTLKKYYKERKLDIPRESEKEIEKETLAIEDAINVFFTKNIDKVSDVKTFGSFIRKSIGDLYANPSDILNVNTKTMDDNSFFWWLATRAAVLSTDFHKEFAEIQDDTIAPIPTQELAIYTNYASIMNKSMFIHFYNGLREAIKEDWKQKNKEQRLKVIEKQNKDLKQVFASSENAEDNAKDYVFLDVIAPRYAAITFTEGITGSGKTNGVFAQTIKMIKKNHSELLDNVFYVYAAGDNTEEAQKKARKHAEAGAINQGLDPKHTTFMSREDYMKTITSNRDKAEYKGKGQYTVNQSRVIYNGEDLISNSTLSDQNIPTLVFVDEVTNIDQLDLDDINNHALKHGYSVITAGDTTQSGVQGVINLNDTKSLGVDMTTEATLTLQLFPTYFPRSPKQGVSMRTANSQKTRNLAALQAWVQDSKQTIPLHFYKDDEKGIMGDTYFDRDDWEGSDVNEDEEVSQDLKNDIQLMIDTLKPDQKIGYVYEDENTKLYKFLMDNYKDKIELLPGTTSQGQEGQYYIIEMASNNLTFVKDMYTAITRSSQASIIVSDEGFKGDPIEDSETHDESLAPEAIKKYSENRVALLTDLTKSGKDVEYIPFIESKKKSKKPVQSPELKNANDVILKEGHWIIYPANPDIVAKIISVDSKNKTITTEPSIPNIDIDQINAIFDSEENAKATLNTQETVEDWLNKNSIEKGNKVIEKGTNEVYTLIDIVEDENNENKHIVKLENSKGDNREISFEDFFKSKWEKYVDEPQITSIKSPQGKDITIGSWILRKDAQTGTGIIAQVTKIEGNKLITEGDFSECLVSDVINVSKSKLGSLKQQESYNKNQNLKSKDEVLDDDGLVDDEKLHEQIETLNSKINRLIDNNTPFENDACNIYLYSFNTCETGVDEDIDGFPIQFGDSELKTNRIDSINGLMKLKLNNRYYNSNPKHPELLTVQQYTDIICELRKIILNTKNRDDISKKIQDVLSKYFVIEKISSTFGLSTHIDDGRSTSTGEFKRATRTPDEKLKFINNLENDPNAQKALKIRRKTISIIIAEGEQDILELPILTFANPLTLFQQQKLPLSSNDYNELSKISDSYKLLTELFKKFKDNNKGISKLIALYLGINMDEKQGLHNGDSFIEFSDKKWTPSNNLTNMGVSVTSDNRGIDYFEQGYNMIPVYTDISKIAENKALHISEQIYYVEDDFILDNNGEPIKFEGNDSLIQSGMPFVLITTDNDLYDDTEMYNAFIEDLAKMSKDTTKTARVKLVYIVPPSVGLQDYVESLAKVITNQNGAEDIGFIYTAYHILRKLSEKETLYNLLSGKVTLNNEKNYIKAISDMIEESKSKNEEELKKWLNETINHITVGVSKNNKQGQRFEIFKRFLLDLYYPSMSNEGKKSKNSAGKLNQENANYLNDLAKNIPIRYRAAKDPNATDIGIFHPIKSTGYFYKNNAGQKIPFSINAAINTNQYIADVSKLLDDILNVKKHKNDMSYYIKRHIVAKPKTNNSLNSVKTFVENEIGINVDSCKSIDEIVNTINNSSKYIAFKNKYDNRITVFNECDLDIISFEDLKGNSTNTISKIAKGKSVKLIAVTKDGTKLDAICSMSKEGKLELEIIHPDDSSNTGIQITEEMFNQIQNAFNDDSNPRAKYIGRTVFFDIISNGDADVVQKAIQEKSEKLIDMLDGVIAPNVVQIMKDIHDSKQEQKTACERSSTILSRVTQSK